MVLPHIPPAFPPPPPPRPPRYGDPKLCKEASDVAFAARFQAECALSFLGAAMQLLAGLAQVGGGGGRETGGGRRAGRGGAAEWSGTA